MKSLIALSSFFSIMPRRPSPFGVDPFFIGLGSMFYRDIAGTSPMSRVESRRQIQHCWNGLAI